jgi:hypothetical protein
MSFRQRIFHSICEVHGGQVIVPVLLEFTGPNTCLCVQIKGSSFHEEGIYIYKASVRRTVNCSGVLTEVV